MKNNTFKHILPVLCVMVCAVQVLHAVTLNGYLNRNGDAWYTTSEAMTVAENVLLLQKDNGGWPKNYNKYFVPMSEEERGEAILAASNLTDATIDNNATSSELLFLARLYQAARRMPAADAVPLPANPAADNTDTNANQGILREAAKSGPFTYGDLAEVASKAFLKGVNFVLELQYDNGGFRQFPREYGYWKHITYNDNAMVNVMKLIGAMTAGGTDDAPDLFKELVPDDLKERLVDSYRRGIECILATQYVQSGVKTVWCAQHDEMTLLPAPARSYELESLSGSESVGIVQLLMDQPDPDDRIAAAIHGAMAWFDRSRITDKKVESFINSEGQPDRRLVERVNGEGTDIWGRFYELDSNRVFVCDRDGIIKYDMKDIGYERRNGYSWYTSAPAGLFPLYEAWKARWNK